MPTHPRVPPSSVKWAKDVNRQPHSSPYLLASSPTPGVEGSNKTLTSTRSCTLVSQKCHIGCVGMGCIGLWVPGTEKPANTNA